jgi:hypothetical protein
MSCPGRCVSRPLASTLTSLPRAVTAPVGVPHTFSHPDPAEWAAFTCTVAPDLYIGYSRDLAALEAQLGGLGEVDEKAILEIMARYATEPYRSPGS